MHKFKIFFLGHKVINAIVLVAVIGGGYWGYTTYTSDDGETRYVLGTVEKGTITSTISASGQVASSDETEVKAKAAGDILSVSAKEGAQVSQGQALASIDSSEARRAVTDAQLAVEEAKINLEHDTLQAPIDYKGLQEDVARAKRDLEDTYEDAYVVLSDAYVNLPDVVAGADSILYDKDIDLNSQNYSAYQNLFVSAPDDQQMVKVLAVRAQDDYTAARDAYTKSAATWKTLTRSSNSEDIGAAFTASKNTAALLAKAVASEANLIDTVIDILERRDWAIDADITAAQTSVRTYVTSANSVLSNLSAAAKNSDNAKDSLTDAEHALELASVGNPDGNNPFDLKLLQNTLKQKEAALADAQQALADHTIRAPFSGILASFDLRRGDSVANEGSVGTLISDQKIAELSLNEVDAAKVKVGNKASLTFDAVEDLTLTGEVAEIDTVGTVTQGVVSYTVKIGFDTQDERVKPGMTVNASIVIDEKQDVLRVPSSAVKTQNDRSYVLVFDPPLSEGRSPRGPSAQAGVTSDVEPKQVDVEVGISDDTHVEILSGLAEGQQIVTRTISGTATATTATTNTSTSNNARGGATFGGPRPF